MHILFSDYDGTVYAHGELLGDVRRAVREWRERGNLFCVATGRDFSMARPELERWGIAVDALVCINGAAVYDGDMTLLDSHLMDDDLIPELLGHPAGVASKHYQFSGLEPLRLFLREGSQFWASGIKYERLSLDQSFAVKRVGQISLGYETEEESIRWTGRLNDELGDRVRAHRNKQSIDVTAKGVDKSTGIAMILARKGWDASLVRAVGDGTNDIAMIRRYGGYAVADASEDVVSAARGCVADVPELMDFLTPGKV